MSFTLPQAPESPNVRVIADYLNANGASGGGGSSTDWSMVTSKPTTLSGYGITDAYTQAASDARYLALAGGTLTGHLVFTDGYGLRSPSGLRWAAHPNAQFWQLVSAGAASAVEVWRAGGTLCGYLYADSSGIGLLNSTGNWAVHCNSGSGMGGDLVGSWSVSNHLAVTGQISSNTAVVTNMLACGALNVAGYSPTVMRSSPISGGVPGDLASGQAWWGY